MQITWTNCTDKMPPDENVIAKVRHEIHITHGWIMRDFYDDYIVDSMQWTPYTQEKWEYLNK